MPNDWCVVSTTRFPTQATVSRSTQHEPLQRSQAAPETAVFGGIEDARRGSLAASVRHQRSADGYNELMRHAFVHTVIDDHTRIAHAEVHDDETALTATAVLARAVAWSAAPPKDSPNARSSDASSGTSPEKSSPTSRGTPPPKNRSQHDRAALDEHRSIERFHRTMADGWAYARHYYTEAERRAAPPGWLHEYNHHRPHSAIGGKPPISRLTSVPGQYT
jgi:hypothetical protein